MCGIIILGEGDFMEKKEIIESIEFIKKYHMETNQLETKSAKNGFPKKCYDSISSFSNKFGGIILFGINEEEDFKVEGVYDINDLQKQITSLCNDAMEPSVRVDIMPIEWEGFQLLAVKIPEASMQNKPVYYKPKGLKSGSYIREGERDSLMTDYEIYTLQSYKEHIFEDVRPNKKSSLEDLNQEELEKYLLKVQRERPNFAKRSFEKNLKVCGILDSNEKQNFPTLAGHMIFGEYPQCFYPQLFIACVVIPGTELGDVGELGERFIDNKRVEGTIEEMLDGTMNFLRRNMKTSVTINSLGTRIDRTEYPLEALREAVANALIHRDYSFQTEGAYISVYMYQDRIEIISPVALYGPNRLEKLGTSTYMESRNPTIVRILEEKGSVIENRHTGITTMRREMKKYNLPMPDFIEERDCFKVIFRNKSTKDRQKQVTGQVGGQQSGQQSGQQTTILEYKNIVLAYCKSPKTAVEIREKLQIKSRQYVSTNIIKPLINEGKLDYINKNSVNAKNQKYITHEENSSF